MPAVVKTVVKTIAKAPWLHFIVIGLCLYGVQQWHQEVAATPITAPTETKMAELRGQWLATTGRPPSSGQMQSLLENEINQEILFQDALRRHWHLTDTVVRQRLLRNVRFLDPQSKDNDDVLFDTALALELHENDLVVRRRLIQRMEMLAAASVTEPADDSALRAVYQQNPQRFIRPELLKFRHCFFSRDQRTDPAAAAKQQLLSLVVLNTEASTTSTTAAPGCDPFLHGIAFNYLNQAQAARYFGHGFAQALYAGFEVDTEAAAALGVQQWLGPIESSYGQHLVFIDSVKAPQLRDFVEVEKQLRAEWRRSAEQQALQDLLARLRPRYPVVTAEAADE